MFDDERIENNLTGVDFSGILVDNKSLPEDGEMKLTKFYNFNCIILYTYIDTDTALAISNGTAKVTVPLRLYESPEIATIISPNVKNQTLCAFAVYVENNVLDRLSLDIKFDNLKQEQINSFSVIRSLAKYEKKIPYIVYTVQNSNVLRFISALDKRAVADIRKPSK